MATEQDVAKMLREAFMRQIAANPHNSGFYGKSFDETGSYYFDPTPGVRNGDEYWATPTYDGQSWSGNPESGGVMEAGPLKSYRFTQDMGKGATGMSNAFGGGGSGVYEGVPYLEVDPSGNVIGQENWSNMGTDGFTDFGSWLTAILSAGAIGAGVAGASAAAGAGGAGAGAGGAGTAGAAGGVTEGLAAYGTTTAEGFAGLSGLSAAELNSLSIADALAAGGGAAGGALGASAGGGGTAGTTGGTATTAGSSLIPGISDATLKTGASLASTALSSRSSGDDGGLAAMDAAEAERQRKIEEAIGVINGRFGIGDITQKNARQSMYDDIAGAVRDTAMRDLDQQFGQASKRNKFGLARAGLLGGSADAEAGGDLKTRYGEGSLRATQQGQQAASDLRIADERTRQNLIGLAQTGLDTGTADAMAASQMGAAADSARAQSATANVGRLFDDMSQAYVQNQVLKTRYPNGSPQQQSNPYGGSNLFSGKRYVGAIGG